MALLTLEDWHALPEDDTRVYELVDGVVQASPKPDPHHQLAAANLTVDLNRQVPDTLAAGMQSEVVINPGFPATVRVPDVLVTSAGRFDQNPPRFDAGDVLLAVEIVSPGSGTTDRITKFGEYARAEIPHYWVIDLNPASLVAYNLVDGHYEIETRSTKSVTLTVDVSRLTDRQY